MKLRSAWSAAASTRELRTGRRSAVRREQPDLALAACCDLDAARAERFAATSATRARTAISRRCSKPSGRTPWSWPFRRTAPRASPPGPGAEAAAAARKAARDHGRRRRSADPGGRARRPSRSASGRLQPAVRSPRAEERAAASRTGGRPLQHVHYEMARVERRDPDFSTTAIHGLDAVRYLAGADYAEARFRYRELPELGTGVAHILVDAVMTCGATAHLAFCPVAGVRRRARRRHTRTATRSSCTCRCGAVWTRRAGCGTSTRASSWPTRMAPIAATARRSSSSAASTARRSLPGRARRGPRAVAQPSGVAAVGRDRRARPRAARRVPAVSGVRARRVDEASCLAVLARAAVSATWRSARRALGPRVRRLDAWRIVGPGGGGTTRRPAISPHDPKLAVLGCDMTGAYITTDGGASLAHVQPRLGADGVRLRPEDAVDALRRRRGRLQERGRRPHLAARPARPGAEHGRAADRRPRRPRVLHRRPRLPGSGRSVTIHAIAVDEEDSGRVYVAASAADSPVPGAPASPTLLLESTDGGRRWSRAASSAPSASSRCSSRAEAASPRARHRRERSLRRPRGYLGAPRGARRRALHVRQLRARPALGRRLRYGTLPLAREAKGIGGGVQVSEDDGRTWQDAQRRAPRRRTRGRPRRELGHRPRARCPASGRSRRPRTRLVAYVGLRGIVPLAAATLPSTASRRRPTAARTWTVVHAESDRPVRRTSPASWIEARALEDGELRLVRLALRPRRRRPTIPTSLSRPTCSAPTGRPTAVRTWAQANSERRGDDPGRAAASTSPPPTACTWIRFDPKRVFIPYTDIGLFRSEDGGEPGRAPSRASPRVAQHDLLARIRPRREGPALGRLQRRPTTCRVRRCGAAPTRRASRAASASPTDGGQTGAPRTRDGGVGDHARAPRSDEPGGKRTLYATALGRGVYKSTDDGRTWTLEERRARRRASLSPGG